MAMCFLNTTNVTYSKDKPKKTVVKKIVKKKTSTMPVHVQGRIASSYLAQRNAFLFSDRRDAGLYILSRLRSKHNMALPKRTSFLFFGSSWAPVPTKVLRSLQSGFSYIRRAVACCRRKEKNFSVQRREGRPLSYK